VDVEIGGAAPTKVHAGHIRSRTQEVLVKYMLMIYDNPNTREVFFGPNGESLMAEVDSLMNELTASGELIGGEALAEPVTAKTIRGQGGVPVVTDGPFVEAKEHFGGYLIVDCDSEARAVEIASRWPNARFCAMEVRPIMNPAADSDP
jgi:hypothetical protein